MKNKKREILKRAILPAFVVLLLGAGLAALKVEAVPPTVQFTTPANNFSFNVGRAIFVAAEATDSDGTIQRVEFYDGTTLIGTDATAPYIVGWNNAFTAVHTITARAFDNSGESATSGQITVNVLPPEFGPAPLSFGPPTVTSPTTGTIFENFSPITISATPGGGSYLVSRVDFYLNTTLVGTDTQSPFSITVNNVSTGIYSVFAKTTATSGGQQISQAVDIRVNEPRLTTFDFEGDGRSDASVFRDGVWYIQLSTGRFIANQFGIATDKIVPADFDGDHKADIAVYRDGNWYYLQSSNDQFRAVQFGVAGDLPQPKDFDGDGRADVAVFRPSDGVWYLQRSTAGFIATQFGANGDKPLASDFDGDGRADLAIFRPSDGVWYLQRSQAGFAAFQFGATADKPTPADFDGDGKTDLAVYRDGVWYLQKSAEGFAVVQFGVATDVPVAADYDGDGKSDPSVFRDGVWYLLKSQNGFTGFQFGAAGDVPIQAAFIR